MARDRKRAKQRRSRRDAAAARQGGAGARRSENGSGAPGARESSEHTPPALERADVPAALDHASSDADEFDAALVRGARGVATGESDVGELDAVEERDSLAAEDELQLPGVPSGDGAGGDGRRGGGGDGGGGGGEGERPSGSPLRGGNRAAAFLRASWAELQRVQWPDRRQVTQATAVVLGFVAIAGAYLGLADFVAKEIVEIVLG